MGSVGSVGGEWKLKDPCDSIIFSKALPEKKIKLQSKAEVATQIKTGTPHPFICTLFWREWLSGDCFVSRCLLLDKVLGVRYLRS